MDDLFYLPSKSFSKRLLKEYEEGKHPRDEKGRWTAGGAGRAALGAAAALGAGALAIRNPAVAGRIVGNVIGAARNPARAAQLASIEGARNLARGRTALATAPTTLGMAAGNVIGATRATGQRIAPHVARQARRARALASGRRTRFGSR